MHGVFRFLPIALLCMASFSGPANAQFGVGVTHTQNRVIERSITREITKAFRPKLSIHQSAGPVVSLALSADERFLMSGFQTGAIRVWSLEYGREVAQVTDGGGAAVISMITAPNGKVAFSGASSGAVTRWDTERWKPTGTMTLEGAVSSLAIDARSERLVAATASGALYLLNSSLESVQTYPAAHAAGDVLLVQGNSGVVSAGADGWLRLRNPQDLSVVAEEHFDAPLTALALSPDESVLAAGDAEGQLHFWMLKDRSLKHVDTDLGALTALSFAASGTKILVGDDHGVVELQDLSTASRTPLGRHNSAVKILVSSRFGDFAISGSTDGTSQLWSLSAHASLLTMISTASGWAVVDSLGRYDGSQDGVQAIAWEDSKQQVNIDNFAETHFQPSLLNRTLSGEPIPEAAKISEGVAYPPQVQLSAHPVDRDGTSVVHVRAVDQGGGVAAIHLFRNGKAVSEEERKSREVVKEDDGATRYEYAVSVPAGRSVISASAQNNERLEGTPQSVEIINTHGLDVPGKVHVLFVGINEYADPKMNLDYARPDAMALASFFEKSGKSHWPLGQVILLNDHKATKSAIEDALQSLQTVPPQDVVIVYLAGHGISMGDEWYFLSHDTKAPDSPDDMKGSAFSSDDLKGAMEKLGAERTLLLLDTCHSGTAVSPLKLYRGMKALRLMARSVGTHVLAATDRQQNAIELEKLKHGLFTYALLQGLGGEADKGRDGIVSAGEILRYVEHTVPQLARDYADYEQFPTAYSRGRDFYISDR